MLDQFDGFIDCEVNYNNGDFAEATIEDAWGDGSGIEEDFWLGSSVQIHRHNLKMEQELFESSYPVGSRFQMQLVVKLLPISPCIAVRTRSCAAGRFLRGSWSARTVPSP
jgi:hypothetical protein